jgi:hypothetical protein
MTADRGPAAAWDAEYRAGRYQDEPPVAFAHDIHFFGATELNALFAGHFAPVLPLRLQRTQYLRRKPGKRGGCVAGLST